MQQSVTCSIRLRSSFAFCVVGGMATVVNMLHSGIAVPPCCTILVSYGRPCLTYHRGTILECTGCAHELRSCWKSTKRSLQRFVLQVHPVSGWLSPFLQSPGTSVMRSVDAAHSKTTKRFGKMAWTACLSSVGCVDLVWFCRCFSAQTVHEQRATTCQRGKLLT